ncbi:hypothetical protein ABZ897_36450 [Nonomuraea sp. NPDC046802]|uniref:hypothetical protein n=1 Tax=Nonomuraea sp. NPDC046802 TaxID=3154919 RepID=UPI0033D5F95B
MDATHAEGHNKRIAVALAAAASLALAPQAPLIAQAATETVTVAVSTAGSVLDNVLAGFAAAEPEAKILAGKHNR